MVLKPSNPPITACFVSWLGYGGLIPFLTFAVLAWTDRQRTMLWQGNLLAYGAVILSFIGALHWGVAMAPGKISEGQRRAMFAWSIVPSLMAFLALAAHSGFGNVLLASGFLLHYGMDQRIAKCAALPAWYLRLRLRLSLIAIICLAAGAFATGT